MKHSYSNDDTCFRIDVIDEILEEDFDELLNEFDQLLYSVDGTILEDEVMAEYDQFMAMTVEDKNESSDDEDSNEEEPSFEKINYDTEHKVRNYIEEPPTDLILKPLPDHLEYAFLEGESLLPVIISSKLSDRKKVKLISVLKNHKRAFAEN